MRIWPNGDKDYAEWNLNKRNGCGKVEWANGNSCWGEYKDGNREGYGTWQSASGDKYIG